MAKEEPLTILGQGPEAWNAWRQSQLHPTAVPAAVNVVQADLSWDDLRKVELDAMTQLFVAYLQAVNQPLKAELVELRVLL